MRQFDLMKVRDLRPPMISGTVSVPLEELDRLRADHANAIRVAEELESRQAQVKVTYQTRERYISHYSEISGEPKYNTRLNEEKVEYRNFEDFRAIIAEEERARVQEKLQQQEDQITKSQEKLTKRFEMISKLEAELKDLKEKFSEASKNLSETVAENTTLKTYLETSEQDVKYLQKELHEVNKKKSFWYWLTNSKSI